MEKLNFIVERIDKITESPGSRAEKVLEILKGNTYITDWDILCFSVEYIAAMSANWPWLLELAKPLAKRLYQAHYLAEDYDVTSRPNTRKVETENESDSGIQASDRTS